MADVPESSSFPDAPPKKAKIPNDPVFQDTGSKSPKPSAPVFTHKLRKAAVGAGCDIRLRVSVSGHPKPVLTWYHNNELLPPSEAQESSGLWIRDCRTTDAGLYTCLATNELGEASCSAVLAVMDLGEDSETTEDETTEPQMETKEGPGRSQDKTGKRGPSGEGGRMMDYNPDALDRRAILPSTYNTVVERELRTLSSRPPGPHLDPTNPARTPSSDEAWGLSNEVPTSSNQPPLSSDKNGANCGKNILDRPKLTGPPASNSVVVTPKLARAGSKIFDKVRAFEERRMSADLPKGPAYFDSDDKGKKTGGAGKEEGRSLQGAAQKRAAFQQRASSLEDKTSYSQRVQSYQNKFAEELQRIKKLVSKPSLRKAYSTEQLSLTDRSNTRKVEPIPPQVVKKLEARERALEERRAGGQEGESMLQSSSQAQNRVVENQSKEAEREGMTRGVHSSLRGSRIPVSTETALVQQLPGQPLPTVTRKSPTSESSADKDAAVPPTKKSSPSSRDLRTESNGDNGADKQLLHRSNSPTDRRASPVYTKEPGSQFPPKSPRFTPSPTRLASPILKKRKTEAGRVSPCRKVGLPVIRVDDKPMETDEPGGCSKEASRAKRKEGRTRKSKECRSNPPGSPEEEGSSGDSYLSADEEPTEAPTFEKPLEDTTATRGSAVTLTCIITGNPAPTVMWKNNNVEIRADAFHVVKADGDRHSLVIKEMSLHNAGSYCVTAVNSAGRASCSATLNIQSEPTQMQFGKTLVSPKVCSPVQSDEEYLSPQEEVMETEDSSPLCKSVNLKERPSFQVAPCDQGVTEGEDVVMTAKFRGQPKPMVNWLKDNMMVKTAGRFVVRETDNGTSELRINSAQKPDGGFYVCKIINEYGTKQAECRLEVKDAIQVGLAITKELRDVAVRAGDSATFECHVTGPTDMDVDWLSNGRLIQPALLNCKMHFDGKRCRLMLNSVHEDDSGTYVCKLSTAKEELISSANLRVTPSREPLFTRKLDILEVIEGRTARFDCKVSGSPAPQVTWMHFEARVEESDNIQILQEGGRHSLVISHVSGDTEGFYKVIAENIHGKAECTAELYMQEPRAALSSHMTKLEKMPSIPEEPEMLESEVERKTMPDFIKPLGDVEVIEGKEAVLKCKVAGLPYPTISWYHKGKPIESSEERKMTQYRDVHSLVIRSACHAHGGVYKAVISNKVGKAACYAHLYVTDIVPDPPDGPPVVETITGKTITLSWKRPRRLDPSLDTSSLLYVVQQQHLGSIQWSVIASNLKETTYTVTTLSKGVRYAFRVLTSTGKSLSKPSPSTDLVQLLDRGPYWRKAPVIVDKPDIVYVVENQPTSITITLNHVHAVVTWKRRGVVLVNKLGTYEMSMPDDDQHTLKLLRVRNSDVGQLVVTASNQFGSDLCTLQLVMAVRPKFETIMEDVDVHIGETSRLAVVVDGKPDPDILWYKDDILVFEGSHFTFVYDDPEYSLVILGAQPEHSGVYTCTAQNLAGSCSCKAELTVHTEQLEPAQPMEDEGTILRKMRRVTDYYDVHKEIGRGAFSYVKKVTLKEGKGEFAAKFISARGKRKALALREMDLLAELDYEKILFFHDAFEKKNVVILITELCHEELLDRIAKKTTVMELEIRKSIQQLLEGLRYLHQKNIAHLDIKPENILMANPRCDKIRICDFGNALKLENLEEHYCKYGTPEYIAPEIVNQTPVSTATDIWPVGVITYLCLTGVSPFAGENDRATALNIRNYNVAFEESMFSGLCKEAKGFVIKLLVLDRLRPSAVDCLRHPWFKSPTNKSICTAMLKQVVSRRRWQRSLIGYKSKMVMRSIPELLNDSSSHVSIAVARHLKDNSPPPSSSSDSDADVDELPFIPMPLSMVFSGSRVSINEIPGDEEVRQPVVVGDASKTVVVDEVSKKEATRGIEDEGEVEKTKQATVNEVSSVEPDELQKKVRRATMKRGSSADSALLLQIDSGEEINSDDSEGNISLKKAISMEIPNRSPSPGATKLSQEEYALKLELMRQRLLRGGSVDKKMSGLRGPLFETLGIDGQTQTGSLDRNLRKSRAGPSIIRAASSESPGEDTPKTKVFRKSVSFTQEDSEPMPLRRRFGAPLEIPSASHTSVNEKPLQEATSVSALTEQTLESPKDKLYFVFPEPANKDQEQKRNTESKYGDEEQRTKILPIKQDELKSESVPPPLIPPIIVIEGDEEEEKKKVNQKLHINGKVMKGVEERSIKPQSNDATTADTLESPEHPAVYAKVATLDHPISSSSTPDLPTIPRHPVLRTDIKDIDSEEVFKARFKKRESSLTRGLRKLTGNKSEEKSPVLSRRALEGGEEVYRPGPKGSPLEMVSKGIQERSKSVQDLREITQDTGFGLIGRFSLRKTSSEKKEEKHTNVEENTANRRVLWAVGRSKSLDTTDVDNIGTQRQLEEKGQRKAEESSVSAMRRRFESKVAGISAKIRSQSEERRAKETKGSQKELVEKDMKKVSESPVLAMRQKFENKVAGISTKIRSHSEDRKGDGDGRSTPLFSRHRHSHSEGRGLKGMGIPENQLAKQSGATASKESIESATSTQSEKESDRRSRWDRWGLTRGKREKAPSQPNLALNDPKDDGLTRSQQFIRSASDFAPVFHIKLKDHVLLEGEPVTLSCLPAGSPHPEITWLKDRKQLDATDDRIKLISHPDGRQLFTISKSSHKDTGVYECVATNPIATITTSCTLSIASFPKRPGTPEVAQTFNNTALVLWRPADTKPPCSYSLERKEEREPNWVLVATGIVDCYYNVTDLPLGGAYKFRVSCVNKAGQGPYSCCSAPITLTGKADGASPPIAVVKTVPTLPEPESTSNRTVPQLKTVQDNNLKAASFLNDSPPTVALPPQTTSPKVVVIPSSSPPLASTPSSIPSLPLSGSDSHKTTASLPFSTPKAPSPFDIPKPQSPVNVVTPMTQTLTTSTPPPPASLPPAPTKPSSVPTYTPVSTATARMATTPVTFSPQMVQTSSLTPIAEGDSTPSRGMPSGRSTPSSTLRQGVPQKPYTFLEEKARGRYGVIRECRENATGKMYMAKIIPYSQETKKDVLKEYEILKSLHSDKIMALHEAYVTPRYLVLVAEFCTGKELLYTLIDRFRYSEDDVASYLVQILQAVEYLHNRRILHLDLKPDNIIVTNLNVVKLVDFGSAQSFNPLNLQQQESGAGALDYMAPEMLKGEVVGPPADMWTVGVVTYIMLSGRLPFEDKEPHQVESKILMAKFDATKLYPNVSQSASTFLKKMLSSYPWARPTTRDCFSHAWLQDSYLMKLRRQTLTFTSGKLKEFLVEQQSRRAESATKHKVLLRTYHGSPRSTASAPATQVPAPK